MSYIHPTTLESFEKVYDEEYKRELASCDRWIEWCRAQDDWYGINFHQGLRSALIFHNIKMEQLLRVLKQEHPNKNHCPANVSTRDWEKVFEGRVSTRDKEKVFE